MTSALEDRGYEDPAVPCAETLRTAAQRHPTGAVPDAPSRGRQSRYPEWFETECVRFVTLHSALFKVKVTKRTVIAHANHMLELYGEQTADLPRVNDSWFQRLLKKYPDLNYDKSRPTETNRHDWTSSENLAKHYVIAAEACVAAGIAVWNEDFDWYVRLAPFSSQCWQRCVARSALLICSSSFCSVIIKLMHACIAFELLLCDIDLLKMMCVPDRDTCLAPDTNTLQERYTLPGDDQVHTPRRPDQLG